jgi:hypothetical protein
MSEGIPAEVTIGQGQTVRLDLTPLLALSANGAAEGGAEFSASSSSDHLEATIDGRTLEIHAGYEAASTVSVTIRAGKTSREIAVRVRPIRWLEPSLWGASGPEEREHASIIPDTVRRRVLMFGGSGYRPYMTPLGDAWSFDLDSHRWTYVVPSGDVPAPRASRRVAVVPGSSTAYVFGGYGAQGIPSNELYRVDFDEERLHFTAVRQENPPARRSLYAFTYDQVTDRFALFGGVNVAPLGDTWTMRIVDGTAVWQEVDPWPAPSPRYGSFYGVDAERGRLVLFSGAQGTQSIDPAPDTWALDLRRDPPAWTQLCAGQPAPRGRRNGCMVFDPDGPRLLVFGGTDDGHSTQPGLFALDARPGKESWAVLDLVGEPPLRSSGFGFYDPATQRVFMGFGNTTQHIFRDWAVLGY